MEFPSVIASVTMCMFLGVALGWRFTSYVLIPGGANALVIGLAVASMGGNGGHSILFIMSINAIALEIGFLFGASIADYLAFREADWRGRAARGGLGVAAENPPISVMMVGLRGCPGVQGGVERHVEQLAPLLAARNCQVEVIARAPHMASRPRYWRGVAVTRVWAPRSRSFEAIAHTAVAILYAAARRPDIVHIHAIGPSILAPFARLFGLRVVVTHHGCDYDRLKWGRMAKLVLKMGEFFGMRFSNARIAVSSGIAGHVQRRFHVPTVVIPNGVMIDSEETQTTSALETHGLTPKHYILSVGRLVPEKRHTDLVAAFEKARTPGWKLVIVGASDFPSDYSRTLEAMARKSPNVVMTGFQSGTALRELYSHAGLFMLPSSHEGLSIALLEAMAAGLRVLASDIPANREVQLPERCYFCVGDVDRMSALIGDAVTRPFSEEEKRAQCARLAERYDWKPIAEQTLSVYSRVMDLGAWSKSSWYRRAPQA